MSLFCFAALHSDPYHVIHDREILSCFFPVHEVRSISDSLTFPCITSNLATQTDNYIRKSIARIYPTMVISPARFPALSELLTPHRQLILFSFSLDPLTTLLLPFPFLSTHSLLSNSICTGSAHLINFLALPPYITPTPYSLNLACSSSLALFASRFHRGSRLLPLSPSPRRRF